MVYAMTEVGKKRKATRALEEATKRMRIETPSMSGMLPTDELNVIFKTLIAVYRNRSLRGLRGRV
jgi:hypothetical protein